MDSIHVAQDMIFWWVYVYVYFVQLLRMPETKHGKGKNTCFPVKFPSRALTGHIFKAVPLLQPDGSADSETHYTILNY